LKIYDLAFKKFTDSYPFMIIYANFLMSLDDEMNTRVLLEKILAVVPKSKSQEIWNTYQKFEVVCGTLPAQRSLNGRYNAIFPHTDPNGIFGLVKRYSYLDLWPCSADEVVSFEGGHCGKLFEEAQEDLGESDQNAKTKLLRTNQRQRIFRDKYVKPDLSKLVLFNPDQILNIYTLPSGETITLPANIGQFLNTLPRLENPYDMEGIGVDIDLLMNMILESDVKLPELVVQPQKRKREEENTTTTKKGASDIYRDRQAAKSDKKGKKVTSYEKIEVPKREYMRGNEQAKPEVKKYKRKKDKG